MKIVLVHGENKKESRERFAKIVSGVKKKDWDVNFIKHDSKFGLQDQLLNQTMFAGETLYVIEELKKVNSQDLDWIGKNTAKIPSQLLLYSASKIPATSIKKIGKDAKVEEFTYPKILFKFLDNLYPGNGRRAIGMFEELVSRQALELVLAMMARLFRDLYWVMIGAEGIGYPDWRVRKIKSQADKFTRIELVGIIDELATIDLKSKTSNFDAKLGIEMMMIKRLG